GKLVRGSLKQRHFVQPDGACRNWRHRSFGRWRRSLQAKPFIDLEGSSRQTDLRQGKRHLDLPCSLPPDRRGIGKDGNLNRSALWRKCEMDQRQTLMGSKALIARLCPDCRGSPGPAEAAKRAGSHNDWLIVVAFAAL